MAYKGQVPTVRIRMRVLPVMMSYEQGVRFCDLLYGPDRLFPALREGNELEAPLPDDGTLSEHLTTIYLRLKNVRGTLGVSSKQIFNWHSRLGCRVWPDDGERHRGMGANTEIEVPLTHWLDHDFYPDVVAAAEVANAVITDIEYLDPATEVLQIRDLDALGGVAARTSLPDVEYPAFGPWRGLAGIPWRTLLSRMFIDVIGTERLEQLPSELAIEHDNGLWTLQRCELPQDSHSDQAADNELTIIETLGQQFFIDRETNQFPTTPPNYPPEFIPRD